MDPVYLLLLTLAEAAVAGIVALIVANQRTEAIKKHAINTEKMKLRYEMMGRRVAGFDQAVIEWQRFTRENPIPISLEPYVAPGSQFGELSVSVALAASLICLSDDEKDVLDRARLFSEACGKFTNLATKAMSERTRIIVESDRKEVIENLLDVRKKMTAHLFSLQASVDGAAERRLESMT